MHVLNYGFKLAIVGPQTPALDDYIPVFHDWIRTGALTDDVMIDVADYAHVGEGPGVLLVCHEGHYVIDRSRGGVGLAYHRKRGQPAADAAATAGVALARVIRAARLLQAHASLAGRLSFDTGGLEVRVLDRLRAPNDDAGWERVRGPLHDAIAAAWGEPPVLERAAVDPRATLTVRARMAARPLAQLTIA
ncbi:MAG: hypothetical protein IPH07_09080 [Deltaproteobacteria bacterium]|nr:hypothetical protein [Deltaproteobacteria bacterium]MBK8236884.1 hypothetical protein [Deltaproteobacteria bacterium]MBK8719096.1 hypothetical protein [Deltaproteobacteria bacterium]MBP7288012.1 hypothetical protein [Nannocystaceae bacterium]